MRKSIPFLLVFLLTLSACGGTAVRPGQPAAAPVVQTAEPAAAPTPEPVVIYDAYANTGVYCDSLGNTWNYILRIPAIQAPGADATRLNQQLYSALYPSVSDALECMAGNNSLAVCEVNYDIHINGSLISIVSRVYTDWGFDTFFAVNYDAARYAEVDRAGLLARFGLDEESFLILAAATMEAHFQQYYSNYQGDSMWQDRHDRSIQRENFTSDCQLFVDDDGKLCMIVKVYSLAGADYYYHILPVR